MAKPSTVEQRSSALLTNGGSPASCACCAPRHLGLAIAVAGQVPTRILSGSADPELCGEVGDGVNQAADLISATASIPSLNFIPLTTFGNWF